MRWFGARFETGEGAGFAIFLGVVLGASLALWFFSARERAKRRLRRARTRLIADLLDGETGRVTGVVREDGRRLSAPLTGRACAWYEVTVSERRFGRPFEVIREARGVPFLLDDGSGRARLEPARARVLPGGPAEQVSGMIDAEDPLHRRFLGRHGEPDKGILLRRSLRYAETILASGDAVTALGVCRRGGDGAAGATIDLGASRRTRLLIRAVRGTTRA